VRRPPVGDHHGGRGQQAGEQGEAGAEDGPVERDARVGVDRTYRAEWREWRQADGDSDGQHRPGRDGADDPRQPVAGRLGRARAERAQRAEVAGAEAELPADHLARDEQRGHRRDAAEDRQRDRRRLDGPLRLRRGERRNVELDGEPLRQHLLDACLGGGHAGSRGELHGGLGEVGAALGEQPGQRRGEQRTAVALDVGVVLGLFRAVDHAADDLHRDGQVRLDRTAAEPRRRHLSVREEAQRRDRADVDRPGGPLGVDHRLVGRAGLSHPALDDGHLVGREVLAVQTAGQALTARLLLLVLPGAEHGHVQPFVTRHVPHAGQGGDLRDGGRVVALAACHPVQAGQHGQVRRVGARQVGGEGGLGAAGGGDRAHGQAAEQPEQQHEREVAGPALTPRAPEPVPRDSEDVRTPHPRSMPRRQHGGGVSQPAFLRASAVRAAPLVMGYLPHCSAASRPLEC